MFPNVSNILTLDDEDWALKKAWLALDPAAQIEYDDYTVLRSDQAFEALLQLGQVSGSTSGLTLFQRAGTPSVKVIAPQLQQTNIDAILERHWQALSGVEKEPFNRVARVIQGLNNKKHPPLEAAPAAGTLGPSKPDVLDYNGEDPLAPEPSASLAEIDETRVAEALGLVREQLAGGDCLASLANGVVANSQHWNVLWLFRRWFPTLDERKSPYRFFLEAASAHMPLQAGDAPEEHAARLKLATQYHWAHLTPNNIAAFSEISRELHEGLDVRLGQALRLATRQQQVQRDLFPSEGAWASCEGWTRHGVDLDSVSPLDVTAEELKEIISSMMQCDYLARPSTMDLLAREELKAHLSPQDLAEAARLTEMQRSTNERIEAVERAEKEARELKEREEMEALLAAEAEKAEKARLADEWVAAQERERDEAQRRKEEDVALGEERRVLAERERIARELAEKEKQEQAASQREEMRAEGSADLSRRERQLENREKELEELMASLRESGANLPTEYEGRASSRSPSRGYRSRSRGRSRPRARPGKWAPITDEPNDSESVPLLNGLLLAQNMPLDNVLRLLHKVEANVRRMQHESGNEFTLNFGPEGFFMG